VFDIISTYRYYLDINYSGGFYMPVIKKSADLRNKYGEISAFCHKHREPIFITKNGEGDLAIMSIETYETLAGKSELYKFIQEGIDDIKNARILTEEEVIKNMERALGK
jgi:PHD/YefM family antitoxin component YafN of YafNO toxin-antitoxin module